MPAQARSNTASTARLLLTAALLAASLACTSAPRPETAPGPEAVSLAGPAFSGMAQHGPAVYLVVHDVKSHRDGPRLGLVEITAEDGARYLPLEVEDWKHPDGRASDLESVCPLPGHPGEYLAAESGSWEGRVGRAFHLRVTGGEAEVLRAFELPFLADNYDGHTGDQFEGVACVARDDGGILVILGERGGSGTYPDGLLRWGTLDLDGGTLSWRDGGRTFLEVEAPGPWPAGASEPRAISDLHAAPDGTLWAAATPDAGDNGPFRSVVYRLGEITAGAAEPVALVPDPSAAWILDGLKVEALAAPTALVPDSVLSFGSEDESYGGVWRPLYPPVEP